MGLVCSCSNSEMRKDYDALCSSRDKIKNLGIKDHNKGIFFFENGPI